MALTQYETGVSTFLTSFFYLFLLLFCEPRLAEEPDPAVDGGRQRTLNTNVVIILYRKSLFVPNMYRLHSHNISFIGKDAASRHIFIVIHYTACMYIAYS